MLTQDQMTSLACEATALKGKALRGMFRRVMGKDTTSQNKPAAMADSGTKTSTISQASAVLSSNWYTPDALEFGFFAFHQYPDSTSAIASAMASSAILPPCLATSCLIIALTSS